MRNPIFIIAEVGQAHEGSLGIAHSYIDALSKVGVDAVKFQMHIAEAESSAVEPFRVKFSYEDKSRFEYWKRMEFTFEQWEGLKRHCEDAGLEFVCSPFSNMAVDLLEKLNVKRYKIGSGEVNNHLLLERISRTGRPVILSSGMSTFDELKQSVSYLATRGTKVSVLQCTTAYPTQPEQWGLNVMDEFRNQLGVPVGFSDHSGEIYACLAACSLGAELLEFHIVFDKAMFGPDSKASLTIAQCRDLASGVRQIERALGAPVNKEDAGGYDELRRVFGKSLAVNKDIEAGHTICFDDLESKKPAGYGVPAAEYSSILGKRLLTAKRAFEFLTREDLE